MQWFNNYECWWFNTYASTLFHIHFTPQVSLSKCSHEASPWDEGTWQGKRHNSHNKSWHNSLPGDICGYLLKFTSHLFSSAAVLSGPCARPQATAWLTKSSLWPYRHFISTICYVCIKQLKLPFNLSLPPTALLVVFASLCAPAFRVSLIRWLVDWSLFSQWLPRVTLSTRGTKHTARSVWSPTQVRISIIALIAANFLVNGVAGTRISHGPYARDERDENTPWPRLFSTRAGLSI